MTCCLSRVSSRSSQLAKLPGPEVLNLFLYSTQLSTKFILLITVKMPTILAFISMINTTSESLKAKKCLFCGILVFMSRLIFVLS